MQYKKYVWGLDKKEKNDKKNDCLPVSQPELPVLYLNLFKLCFPSFLISNDVVQKCFSVLCNTLLLLQTWTLRIVFVWMNTLSLNWFKLCFPSCLNPHDVVQTCSSVLCTSIPVIGNSLAPHMLLHNLLTTFVFQKPTKSFATEPTLPCLILFFTSSLKMKMVFTMTPWWTSLICLWKLISMMMMTSTSLSNLNSTLFYTNQFKTLKAESPPQDNSERSFQEEWCVGAVLQALKTREKRHQSWCETIKNQAVFKIKSQIWSTHGNAAAHLGCERSCERAKEAQIST